MCVCVLGTARNTLDHVSAWLAIVLTVVLCVLPVLIHRFLNSQLSPTINDKVQTHTHNRLLFK